MAKINELSGALSGAIGPVVASSWRGVKYFRSAPRRSTKPPTEKQLQHRARIALVSKFIYGMKDLLDDSFTAFAVKKTGSNAAFSYNFKNAVEGVYPHYGIHYSRALLSRGDLPNADHISVVINAEAQLHFSWADNSGTGQAMPGDLCTCVVHEPGTGMTLFVKGAADRRSGSAMMDVVQFRGKAVETWLAFSSAGGKECSDSVYTGRIVVL